MSAVLTHGEITPPRPNWLAGAPGFEPGNGGIKIRCRRDRQRARTRSGWSWLLRRARRPPACYWPQSPHESDQLCRMAADAFGIACPPAIIDPNIAAFGPPKRLKLNAGVPRHGFVPPGRFPPVPSALRSAAPDQ